MKGVRWMVAVAAALFVLAVPTVAWAANATQTCTYPDQNCVPVNVLPETLTKPAQPSAVEGTQASQGSSLPFTGGDVAGLAAIGVAAIGVGYVMHRRGRTRTRIQS
jgi:hypothetical protein